MGGYVVSAIGENRNVWYRLCFWMLFLVFFAVANCGICGTVNMFMSKICTGFAER